ncbi:DNA mismatch repair protein MutS [bacterium]|nr:DNA mismatch repair protein MutS [Chloroflexi bacterium CFX6]RIL07030.1 MAG: DNA mismatch repair protein MutS [bacterium]
MTPMMRQWAQIKRQHPDAIVLFRLGDFYEAFNEDAARLADVCDVTLTSRPVAKGERAPMAGVPYHAVDGYIAQLVRRGLRVAIVEQTGPEASPEKRARMSRLAVDAPAAAPAPPPGKGIMAREVVRVVTPGTLVEGDLLDARAHNYLAALVWAGDGAGLAHADVTTGDFATTDFVGPDAERRLLDELVRLRPAELIVPEARDGAADPRLDRLTATFDALGLAVVVAPYAAWRFDADNARRALLEHFRVATLAPYGCADRPLAARAAGAVLAYLRDTHKTAVAHVGTLSTYATDAYMQLDAATRRNLEITSTLRGDGRKASLLGVLDATLTPMGGRCLRTWLDQPLVDRARIERRLDAVEALAGHGRTRAELRAVLKGLPDIERLANRVTAGYAGPRELVKLADGLRRLPAVRTLLAEIAGGPESLARLGDHDVADVAAAIDAAIADDPPAVLGVPGVIRPGHAPELDAIHASVADARAWIAGLEAAERERTGIRKLKVGYNRVFGYYLELPKAAADQVPADYHRKQTTTGGERYVTPELKERETEVLHAEERIVAAERALFVALVQAVMARAADILAAARDIGMLDALASLAEVAVHHRYTRPVLDDGRAIAISAGRHPVVERNRPDAPFVPNDVAVGPGEIILLTGPNMAGKSTVGRMVALVVLMAQIGSFVPADAAAVGIVDRIFTRIGAQDELAAGQSTFMVEMVETAGILHHATARSLIILDELGRGTSTYDGMAIAWAVIEHIHNHPRLGARTLFATHYHELTALAELLPRVRNFNMAVAETPDGIAFLHRIEPGTADRSYGIHVAELAGLPRDVTARAWTILERLEAEGNVPLQRADRRPPPAGTGQLPLFAPVEREHPVVEALRRLDVDGMTPLAALTALYELRGQVSEPEGRQTPT